MATSNTYLFNPHLGEIALTAFERIGVRRAGVTSAHLHNAKQAANLILSEWSNKNPNLWEVGLVSTILVQGTATYTLNANTAMVLDAYLSTGTPATDTIINSVSRSHYAAQPDKTIQGRPTQYWFNKVVTPTITLWPVPDGNGPYTLNLYTVRQTQDANLANAENVEIPYRALDAFVSALAWKLAEIYKPDLERQMFEKSERAWNLFAGSDVEMVPLYIVPSLSGYYS